MLKLYNTPNIRLNSNTKDSSYFRILEIVLGRVAKPGVLFVPGSVFLKRARIRSVQLDLKFF